MAEWQRLKASERKQCTTGPTGEPLYAEQERGNQAVLDELGAGSFGMGDGYLDGLDFDAPGPTADSMPAWASEAPGDIGIGNAFGLQNEQLGEDSLAADAIVSTSADGVMTGAARFDDTLGDRGDGGVDVSVGFHGNSEGQVAADVDMQHGGFGGGGSALLDFAQDGSVEFLALQARGSIGDHELAADLQVQPETVSIEGTTVAWASSVGAGVAGESNGIGAGVKGSQARHQQVRFSSESDAQAFAESLSNGQATPDLSTFGAGQVAALPAGIELMYENRSSGAMSAKFGAGANVGSEASRQVRVRVGVGQNVSLRVTERTDQALQGSVDNGAANVEAGGGVFSNSSLEYRLDLSNPEHRAIFDHFQATGELHGIEPASGERFQGTRRAAGLRVPLYSQGDAGFCGRGQVIDGQSRDASRCGSSQSSDRSTVGEATESAGELMGLVGRFGMPLWAAGGPMIAEYGAQMDEESFASHGSDDGRRENVATVTTAGDTELERTMQSRILQRQVIDLDDRREITKVLWDEVTPGLDMGDDALEQMPLPDPEHTDREWVLESEIDERGAFAVRKRLHRGGEFGWEDDGLMAVQAARETYVADGGTSESFRDAAAQLAKNGGSDAMEGMRNTALAGGGSVEQFLMLKGDPNWAGRAGNRALDREVRGAITAGAGDKLANYLKAENDRKTALLQGDYLEVPPLLRDAEIARIDSRIALLQEAL